MQFLLALILLYSSTLTAERLTLTTPRGGDFEIQSTIGKLSTKDLRGKHLFIVFGFGECHDVCPVTLQRFRALEERLSTSEKKTLRYLFISVDNERDSIDGLRRIGKALGQSFIGAVDSDPITTSIAKLFGARYARFKNKRGQLVVDHTDSIFYVNPKGEWAKTLPYGTGPQELLRTMQTSPAPKPYVSPYYLDKLGGNEVCDLAESPCDVKIGRDNFRVRLGPSPIKLQRPLRLELTVESQLLTPVEADFEGVDLNMGYIRPALKLTGARQYSGDLQLPICELKKMTWRIRLVVKNKVGEHFYLAYKLTTLD